MEVIECDRQVDSHGWAAVQTLLAEQICRSVHYDRQMTSTNSVAMSDLQRIDISRHDGLLPRLYLADQQTAGRGRLGRGWISNDETLTFSLLVNAAALQDAAPLLSMAAGVGVAQAIEHVCPPFHIKLKWPNDVYLSGGKVAGLLVEGSQRNVDVRVIGIGINVGWSPSLDTVSPAGDSGCQTLSYQPSPATNLATVVGRPLSRYDFLEPVVRSVLEVIDVLPRSRKELLDEFRSRCLLTNQPIRLASHTQTTFGTCRGVNDSGELMVENETGKHAFHSGEVQTVRRRD